jgi:hypothetical protein
MKKKTMNDYYKKQKEARRIKTSKHAHKSINNFARENVTGQVHLRRRIRMRGGQSA